MTLFEDILAGRSPGEIAYQDDRVGVIMDIAPMNPGLCLVIPRTPASGLQDLDPVDGERMFRVGSLLPIRQSISLGQQPFSLGYTEPAAGTLFKAWVGDNLVRIKHSLTR